jgi:glycosyltransferase involved in cell wall biosynthesis
MNSKPVLGYILKGYPRISETFISNEILQLEHLGFKIIIFPMRKPRENFCHDSVKQIQAPVYYLPTHLFRNFIRLLLPNVVLACKKPRRYTKAFFIACKRFGRTYKIATFKHLLQAGYMTNNYLLRDEQVNHLHGHFAHSPTSVTMFASLLSGIPFSFTAHAKDIYTSNEEQLKEKIDKARFVVTCTRYNAEHLKNVANHSTTPIHCIYHGIDTSLFSSNGSRNTCKPPFKLLTVARITEKKGLPTLYEALARLKAQGVTFNSYSHRRW